MSPQFSFEGYCQHPSISRLYVSRDGRFLDVEDLFSFLPRYYPSGYVYIYIRGFGEYACHRLICETFLDCPGKFEDYQVNHIDGNKYNFALENLEWVSASENSIHAYKTGLRDDNRPVLVKDLRTETIESFYSLTAAATFLGVNPGKLHLYLNSTQKVPFQDVFDIVYEGAPWRGLGINDIGVKANGAPRAVVAISETVTIIFDSYGAAADHFGVHRNIIGEMCRSNGDKTFKNFRFVFLTDFKGNVNDQGIRRIKKENSGQFNRPQKKPVPITVFDSSTEETTNWNSTEDFAKSVGVCKNTIQKSVLRTGGLWKGYKIRYGEYKGPLQQ